MKRAALQFSIEIAIALSYSVGETMGETECGVVHIRGTKTIFSCYDVGENVTTIVFYPPLQLLAFFTDMHPTALEVFDTASADDNMRPITESLRLLLHGGF